MNPTPRTDTLSRLVCAAGAALATMLIGVSIHALAHHYEAGSEQHAAAHPPVVALATPR